MEYEKAAMVRVEGGNLMIPRSWSIKELGEFAGEIDRYFEEDYDTVPCYTWARFSISGRGIILEISVRDDTDIGDINIYEEETAGDGEYFVFNGFDIYPLYTEEDSEYESDYLSDIAEALYKWLA